VSQSSSYQGGSGNRRGGGNRGRGGYRGGYQGGRQDQDATTPPAPNRNRGGYSRDRGPQGERQDLDAPPTPNRNRGGYRGGYQGGQQRVDAVTSPTPTLVWADQFASPTSHTSPSASTPTLRQEVKQTKEKEEKGIFDDFPALGTTFSSQELKERKNKEEKRQREKEVEILEKEAKERKERAEEAYEQIDATSVAISEISYSQQTCAWLMKDEHGKEAGNIGDVAANMQANGWNKNCPAPNMVIMGDGTLVTLDHRRIVAANLAGLTHIPGNIHLFDEEIWPKKLRGFYRKGPQIPETWGEAVILRSGGVISKELPKIV
jgi:hypothetical protein